MKRIVIIMIVVFSIVSIGFMFLGGKAKAGGGCGKWEGIPSITMKLPGEGGGEGHEKCKKEKEGTVQEKGKEGVQEKGQEAAEGKKCAHEKGKEGGEHHCACYRGITIGIGDVEKFHSGEGIGPGVALGYRACQIAFSHLYPGEIPPRKDQFVVLGAEKDCPADAVTYITGARYGKGAEGAFNGNLVFDKSLGAFNFIFASMSNGKVVKLTSKFQFPKEFMELKEKSKTDPEAKEKSFKLSNCLVRKVLTAPESEIFEVTPMPECSWKTCKEKYSK